MLAMQYTSTRLKRLIDVSGNADSETHILNEIIKEACLCNRHPNAIIADMLREVEAEIKRIKPVA